MTINEAIKIVDDMIEALLWYDDVVLYDYEEEALDTLISAAKELDDLFGGNPPKF